MTLTQFVAARRDTTDATRTIPNVRYSSRRRAAMVTVVLTRSERRLLALALELGAQNQGEVATEVGDSDPDFRRYSERSARRMRSLVAKVKDAR